MTKILPGMKTLKPGDTVHFRCGGKAVVSSATLVEGLPGIKYEGDLRTYYYMPNGERFGVSASVMDIIKITKGRKG